MENVISSNSQKLAFSAKEVAKGLGIGVSSLYEAISRNEFPHIKIGRRILIPRVAFEKMLEVKNQVRSLNNEQ